MSEQTDKLYMVTGATGHLGTVLVDKLIRAGKMVRCLVLPGEEREVSSMAEVCKGDVTDAESLDSFFADASGEAAAGLSNAVLIHCAAKITIATEDDPEVRKVNITGTENVLRLALERGVGRVIYVSSVHAIPAPEAPALITEIREFSEDLVHGQYARSKAAAAQIALDYAAKGLNLSIVHPSGIIGPGDHKGRNHMIRTIRAMAAGRINTAPEGGYDFVDSRDVADGILACAERGRAGECYILNGHYITVRGLIEMIHRIKGEGGRVTAVPHEIARIFAPAAEYFGVLLGSAAPLYTPYAVETLKTNANFSHEKAARELGYSPRELEESVRDSL